MLNDDFPIKQYLDEERIKILANKAIDIFALANDMRKNKIVGKEIKQEEAKDLSEKVENFRISLRGLKDTEYEQHLPLPDDEFETIFRFIEELAINALYKE